jgi:hypothetical protein
MNKDRTVNPGEASGNPSRDPARDPNGTQTAGAQKNPKSAPVDPQYKGGASLAENDETIGNEDASNLAGKDGGQVFISVDDTKLPELFGDLEGNLN